MLLRRTTDFFSKVPLLNPNIESRNQKEVLVFLLLKEESIQPSFFDIFLVNSLRKEKVKKSN